MDPDHRGSVTLVRHHHKHTGAVSRVQQGFQRTRFFSTALTKAAFVPKIPLGGQVGDPQTWNRYVYSRNDPINMNDPSGQGFWNWFAFIGSIAADIATAGASSELTVGLGATLGATEG